MIRFLQYLWAQVPHICPVLADVGRLLQLVILGVMIVIFMGAGDETARFNDLGHKLMCRCGCNQVLLECNHVGCSYSDKMRGELIAAIQRGDNDSMVLQRFVQEYGTVVLAAPTTTGFNRVAWIMPFAVLGLGLSLVVVVVRAWHRYRAAPAPTAIDPAVLNTFRERARQETEI